MKKVFQSKIKNIQENQIQEYSNEVLSDNIIGGEREKRFVRFSSAIFDGLIEELKNNPNSVFDTYVNDIIKEGYTPEFISVLLKKQNNIMVKSDEYGLGHFRDVVASKVLNFFGCSTTYEALVNIEGEVKPCSVDFNKMGEDLYMSNKLLPHHGNMSWDLDDSQFYLTRKFKRLANDLDIDDSDNEMFASFMNDYIYSYLIRKLVIQDGDYGFHNLGIIHDTKENILRMAPNFDFEYAFMIDDYKENASANRYIEDTFKYVKKYYPQVFEKFSDKFVLFIKNNEFEKIVKETIGANEDSKKFVDSYQDYLKWLNRVVPIKHRGKETVE